MDTPLSSDEARRAESAEIRASFLDYLAPRNAQTEYKWAASHLAERPKTALEKFRVTPEEQEEILFQFASTSSIPKTAALAGVPVEKVRAVIFNPDSTPFIDAIRERLRVNVITKIEDTQASLLEALQDPNKLQTASLREISGVFAEISSTQVSLMNASREASGGFSAQVDPAEVFSGEELEYMSFLRRRLSVPSSLREAGGSPASSIGDHNEFVGHEFVDVRSNQVDPGFQPLPEVEEENFEEMAEATG